MFARKYRMKNTSTCPNFIPPFIDKDQFFHDENVYTKYHKNPSVQASIFSTQLSHISREELLGYRLLLPMDRSKIILQLCLLQILGFHVRKISVWYTEEFYVQQHRRNLGLKGGKCLSDIFFLPKKTILAAEFKLGQNKIEIFSKRLFWW